MCGIIAIASSADRYVDCDLLRSMSLALRHRGPNDEGYILIERQGGRIACYAGNDSPPHVLARHPRLPARTGPERFDIALAHRRFTVVDEAGGHQPLVDVGRNCCLTFHGEIYNYRELREELRRLGHTFASSSDTEVVLEAYKAWGTGCLQRFNGAWAFVLWDFNTKRLIASRDRLGEAPLYWTRWRGALYVASEIKALLCLRPPNAPSALNRAALQPFVEHSRRDLGDSTFFEDIHCFPPASWAILDESFPVAVHRYWEPPRSRLSPRDVSAADAADRLRYVVRDAVRLRLPPDAPWCMELSGGLDTSILVALAAEISADPVVTYTIRYADQRSRVADETGFAAAVARYHNTDHRVVDTTLDRFWQDMPAFAYQMEEPYHAPNIYARHLMQRRMKEDGFKVVCAGSGGDELFAGYSGHFLPGQLENLARGRLLEYLRNELLWPRSTTPGQRLARLPGRVRTLLGEQRRGSPCLLSAVLHCDLLNTGIPHGLRSNGIPYWVRTEDRVRMGIPIEGRAPLCDHRVVELAFSLPTHYLIRSGWHKWILRLAFGDVLPKEVAWRRSKSGLQFPFAACFSQYPAEIREMLGRSHPPYGDMSNVSEALQPSFRFAQDDWQANTDLWRRMSFLLWLDCFVDNPRTEHLSPRSHIGYP